MPSSSSLRKFMATSRFRSAELGTATILLAASALFLVFPVGDAGRTADLTSEFLWISAIASLALPVIVVTHTGYDLIARLRNSSEHEARNTTAWILTIVLRMVELVLAGVLVAVFGFYGFLVTTQPGGEGAGAIVVGMVLLVAITSGLLSIAVLARGLVDYTQFDAA